MLPQSKYDPALLQSLTTWLIEELRQTMTDRGTLEKDWEIYETIYRARPVVDQKTFPFRNASNLVVALMAADTETLYARMMGLLLEPPNMWSVAAQSPEMTPFAAPTQEFLEWAQHNELKLREPLSDWVLEIHKLGTGILKQRYNREMQKVFEWRELGQQTWQQQAVVMMKDAPAIHHVRLHDFYIPAGFKDIQQAPWCAERVRMTWQQYMNRVKAGIYSNAYNIGNWFYSPPVNNYQSKLDDLSRFRPARNKLLEFYEFWLNFDIDGDGWDEALVCTIHLESQTYVRADFNPFFNQEKPYSAARFLRDVNSFYGIGLGEMLRYYQEGITAIHNQRIDSNTVQNTAMFAVKKDNTNIKANEGIWAGKIWKLNDPKNDIVPLRLGMGTSLEQSVEVEAAMKSEAQRRDGVNDYIQGNATPSTAYGAAYTTQQMLASSSKRSGETLREIRDALAESGVRVLEMYQQFNQRGKPFVLGQKDGTMVNAVLQFPLDLIRRGLRVSVTAIDVQQSKDVQIRTTTLVLQQLQQFYMGYLQAAQYALNPQLPALIRQGALTMMQGSSTLMRRLLELMGQQDADTLIPSIEDATRAQQRELDQLRALLVLAGGGDPSAAGASAQPGMAGPAGQGAAPGVGLPAMGGNQDLLGAPSPLSLPGSAGSAGPDPLAA